MLLDAKSISKSIGAKYLFQDLSFLVVPGEKIALIGRNGHGKTTLLKILGGEDHDFEGSISTRRNLRVTLTKQEHFEDLQQSPLDYILKSVPHYYEYLKIIDEYENDTHTNMNQYLKVVEYCTEKRYFNLKEAVISTLEDFGVSLDSINGQLSQLSGGQKRYVEMTRMMFSQSDLFLVDEPTNHMDYLGKERFITWMKTTPQAMVIVTHDRDLLQNVSKIIELKDQKIEVFKGNYDKYINQNALSTLTSVKLYSDQLNRLKEAKKRVEWGLKMRATSKQWKIRYDHWLRDYEKIKEATVKPSFWIDQNSVEKMDQRVVDSYQKFKQKNIKISVSNQGASGTELVMVKNLSLGYDEPVFENLTFYMRNNDRVFIKGRNGAGKSTLVKTIIALANQKKPQALHLDGEINLGSDVRIGEYEQEISDTYLHLSLDEAVRVAYERHNVAIDERRVNSLLAQYLFDPAVDKKQKVINLSGGQKARFQLIKMLVAKPNLLILDEPTNHLDLPSIEELENALINFDGGILYISHDTYFIKKIGGDVVEI